MGDEPYHPSDPAFLLSRSLDEELSRDDRRRLDTAMALSSSLREEAERLRTVDRLVKRWGARSVALDWENHTRLAVAQAASDDDGEALRTVDGLLERWGADAVRFDERRFTAAVMKQVARELRSSRMRRALVIRLGAPLAAAAAIALAVTVWLWRPAPEAIRVVTFGPRLAMAPSGTAEPGEPTVVVSFNRMPVDPGVSQEGPPGIAFGAVGPVAPVAMLPGESAPL